MSFEMSDEELAEFVARSRAAQGLPPRVTDPTILRRIAALLAPPGPPPKRSRSRVDDKGAGRLLPAPRPSAES